MLMVLTEWRNSRHAQRITNLFDDSSLLDRFGENGASHEGMRSVIRRAVEFPTQQLENSNLPFGANGIAPRPAGSDLKSTG